MLEELVAIKHRREDEAAAAVGEARQALARRQAEYDAKKRELADYDIWQETERARLFEDVRNTGASRAELERYREQIGLLRQRQLQLEEELAGAEREAAAAKSDLDTAREAHLAAHREVLKFEEYQGVLERGRMREAGRREEAENEDIATHRR